jgi:HK97 family phage portal protein
MDLAPALRSFMSRAATPVVPLWQNNAATKDVGKPAVYPAPNVTTYINAYNTNATIRMIVDFIAERFGNIPRFTYAVEDEQAEQAMKWLQKQRTINLKELKKVKNKAYGATVSPYDPDLTPEAKLAALTARPNDKQGQDAYYIELAIYYALLGEAFIYLNRGIGFGTVYDPQGQEMTDEDVKKLPVLEKVVLPAQFVNPVPSKEDVNEILYYRFEDTPGHFVNIRACDIIHWRTVNPNYDGSIGTHLRGLSKLASGLKLLTQDNSGTDASVAMQQNQGAKGLLFNKTVGNPSPEQTGAIRDVIDTNINNRSRKGSVAFLGGADYGYLDMGQSSVDLQLTQSMQQVLIRLCNLFGVPPAIFLTETTYENLQQAVKFALTNKILPMCCAFRDEENRVLLPSFQIDPRTFTTDIDATLIPELAEDMTALALQLNNSPWKTLNEKREAMGDEEMDDPNMDKILVNNTQIFLEDITVSDGLDSFGVDSGSGNTDSNGGAGQGLHEPAAPKKGNANAAGDANAR